MQNRLRFIDEIQAKNNPHVTPCTECYNIKLLLLFDFAYSHKISTIAFGHHGTDSIVSLMKSVFYYIDRWEFNNLEYKRKNFESIVETNKNIIQNVENSFFDSTLFTSISKLANKRVISTDEPPKSLAIRHNSNFILVRPLFNIFEKTIVDFIAKSNITT